MAVTSAVSTVEYAGDGATTQFAVPFYFIVNADLTVTLISDDGSETTLELDTDYTVTGAGDENGGTVTLNSAPAADETLRIDRNVPYLQPTRYPENERFPAASHERAL